MSNESIVRDLYDSLNARDFDREKSLLTPDAVWTVPGTGERYEGADACLEVDKGWISAFPDGRVEVLRVAAAGDTVVAEFLGRGTHDGVLVTPDGEIPPTGRAVELAFCDVITLREGRISELHEYFDSHSLLTQLGLVPEAV